MGGSGVGFAEFEVVGDGSGEEEGLLGNDGELFSEPVDLEVFIVLTVEEDLTFGGVVEAEDEVGDSGFSGSGGADEGEGLPGFQGEGDVVDGFGAVGVGEGDVFELDAAVGGGEGLGIGGAYGFILLVEDEVVDSVGGGLDLVVGAADVGDLLEALVDHVEGLNDGDDLGDDEEPLAGEEPANEEDGGDGDGTDEFDGRPEGGDSSGPGELALVLNFHGLVVEVGHVVFGGKGFDDSGSGEGFLRESGELSKVSLDIGLGGFDAFALPGDDPGDDRDEEEGDNAQLPSEDEYENESDQSFDGAVDGVANDHDGVLVEVNVVGDNGLKLAGAFFVEEANGEPHEFVEELSAQVGRDPVCGFAEEVDLSAGEPVFEEEEENDGQANQAEGADRLFLALLDFRREGFWVDAFAGLFLDEFEDFEGIGADFGVVFAVAGWGGVSDGFDGGGGEREEGDGEKAGEEHAEESKVDGGLLLG